MIVNPTQTGWEIIYHRAHALLAAQIAAHWGREERPVRLIETIAAISHHDDLEREWEGKHLTEAGTPLDYTLNPDVDVPLLRSMVASAVYRGRWVALLISRHLDYVQAPREGEIPELDAFLTEQRKQREVWRQELGIEEKDLEEAHDFLCLCDQLSLTLCQRALPDRGLALEIGRGPDGRRYDVRQRDDGTVQVEPWPFGPERFTVSVDTCELTQVRFDSDEELTEALQKAPVKALEWELVG